jgi:hypothetical protein
MKRTMIIVLALILSGAVFAILWTPVRSAFIPKEPQLLSLLYQDQQEGWQVCAVGNEAGELIPGVGYRQIIDLCHNAGWRIKTYCLNPGQPPPKLNAFCSQTSPGVFWCGAGVQMVQRLAVLETPGAQASPTPTRTRTPTRIATRPPAATATLVISATSAITRTGTSLPQIEDSPTPTRPAAATATPYYRPRAGGPGNLEVGGILLSAIALLSGGGWWFWRKVAGQAARGG